MLPSRHIILGFLASLLLLWIYPEFQWWGAVIIFLSSVLIDVDHYLFYTIKHRDFSLSNAYRWFIKHRDVFLKLSPEEREKMERAIIIFHGVECWILLALLMLVHYVFGLILIGFFIHMIFDFIDLHKSKVPHRYKISQWHVHKRNKKLKELVSI